MNAKRTTILSVISLLILLPNVLAGPLNYLEGPFSVLSDITKNSTVVFGLTMIFFFMLQFGIFSGALQFVPVFKGSRSSGVSKEGKVVAAALSGLSTLSIFYFTKGGILNTLQTVLDPFGIFAGVALAALFTGVAYYGIKGDSEDKRYGLMGGLAGFGMIIAGLITTQDSIMHYGFLIMILAFFFSLPFWPWGGGSSNSGNDSNGGGNGNGNRGNDNTPEVAPRQAPGDGLDWSNPGFLKVRVSDIDNTPLENVSVKIYPKQRFNRAITQGSTNQNGFFPKTEQGARIGEGHVTIVTKVNPGSFFKIKNRGAEYNKTPFFVKGGEQNPCEIQLDIKSKEHYQGEPKVLSVEEDPENPNNMILTGVIN